MRGFVVFSDNWGAHPSSCQHLFRRIVADHPVIWVNTVMRWPRPSAADLAKVAGKLRGWLAPAQAPAAGPAPRVLNPVLWPGWGLAPERRLNARRIAGALAAPMARRDVDRWVLLTTIPVVADVFDALPAAAKVYYCVDEYAEWPGHGKDVMTAQEARLLERVDLVVATSRHLQRRKTRPGRATELLTHGVDVAHFAGGHGGKARLAEMGVDPARRVVGFFGLLDERIDPDLVIAVARARPDDVFLFVGPRAADMGRLEAVPNVRLLPPVPYAELPCLASGFDVAWLPYRINALTVNIHPLKLKEYLALGCPVLSTPLPEVADLAGHVTVAAGADACAAALAAWAQAPPSPADATRAFVQSQSWEAKAAQLLAWIDALDAAPAGEGAR